MTDQAASGGLQDRQITLAGKSFTIRMGVKAWLALQDLWGLDEDATRERVSKATLKDLPAIMWASMRTHHKDVTLEEVLDLLDDAGSDGIVNGVRKMMVDSQPPPQPDEGQAETTKTP